MWSKHKYKIAQQNQTCKWTFRLSSWNITITPPGQLLMSLIIMFWF